MRFDLGPSLVAAREAAMAELDRLARDRAAALGGDTPAHAAKREEAQRLCGDPAPISEYYPMLSAEVGVTAETLLSVALVVEEKARGWKSRLGQIEAARLMAKAAIRNARSHPEIRSIIGAFREDQPPP